jgi:membrane protease YdiL (CAAX protease family)
MGFRRRLSGCIAAPPRSSPLAAVIVLAVIGALTAAMVVSHKADPWILAALALLLLLAIAIRAVYAIHMALLALVWLLWLGYIPYFRWWPFHLLAPIIFYGLAVIPFPPLRGSVGWLRMGRFGAEVWAMVVATVILSAAALILWTAFTGPNLAGHLAMMPKMPLYAYPLAAIGFAFLNAGMEEVIFRGIMLEALDSALGETSWSLGMQAVSFAALHYLSGFPNGGLGVLMVFVYGLMLGMVRRRAGGLLAPWIAHVAADITIFTTLVVILARK